MRIRVAVLSLTISVVAVPAVAEPIEWYCTLQNPAATNPSKWVEADGYFITPGGETNREGFKYKITQESDESLIAEIPFPTAADMGLSVILLNKKTGIFRMIELHAQNGFFQASEEGICVRN
jgi:hypothetical protein